MGGDREIATCLVGADQPLVGGVGGHAGEGGGEEVLCQVGGGVRVWWVRCEAQEGEGRARHAHALAQYTQQYLQPAHTSWKKSPLRGTMKERGSTVVVVSLRRRAVSFFITSRPRFGTRAQPLQGVVDLVW